MYIEDENEKILRSLLLNSVPILFLGSGFSIGATNKEGNLVKNVNELKERLIGSELKIKKDDPIYEEISSYDLKELCDYFEDETSKEKLKEILISEYKDVQPQTFHYYLKKYPWEKIYTTNIDDLVEQIYKGKKNLVIQNDDKEKVNCDNSIEYIKLHGCVNNSDKGFIFSSKDYIDSIANSMDFKLNTFVFDIQKRDFIFVGTNFDEEDIEHYLKVYEISGYGSARGKLIFINPNPSIKLTRRINKLNGVIIKWKNEQFMNFLSELKFNPREKERELLRLNYKGFFDIEYFRKKFDYNDKYKSRLYQGYECEWEDVFSEWDFNIPLTEEVINRIKELNYNSNNIFNISLVGKSFVGKSCMLKRIGIELLKYNYNVYEFNHKYLDVNSFMNYITKYSTSDNIALLIDNGSFYYPIIEKFLLYERLINKKLIIITTSREYYHYKRKYYLIGKGFEEKKVPDEVDEAIIENLLCKLEEKGFLGELSKLSNHKERLKYLISKKDILTCMLSVNYGNGFNKRIEHHMNKLRANKSTIHNKLIICLSAFEKANIPYLPKELIPLIFNIKLENLINHPILENIIKHNHYGISIRNSYISNSYQNSINKQELFDCIKMILIKISPQVSEKQMNYWKVIFECLAKEEVLREKFKFSNNSIKELLYDIHKHYKKISYYWLQLGLVEQKAKDFERALNHLKQAETIKPNAYQIQHAIGRNYLKQAINEMNLNIAKNLFDSGEKLLTNLIDDREHQQARAFSIHCLINEKIRFYRKFNLDTSRSHIKKMGDLIIFLIEKNSLNDQVTEQVVKNFMTFIKERNLISNFRFNLNNPTHKSMVEIFNDINIENIEDVESIADVS